MKCQGERERKRGGECKGGRENEGKTEKRVEFRPCCHSVCIVAANILRLAGTWHEAREKAKGTEVAGMRHEAVGRVPLHVAGGKAKALQRSERCDGCASYAADVESAKSAYNQGNECHKLPTRHPLPYPFAVALYVCVLACQIFHEDLTHLTLQRGGSL